MSETTTKLRKPCNDCPWRRDAPPGYWHPDHFASISRNCRADGLGIMHCHKSARLPREERLVCQGWVRSEGFNAIGVRLAAMAGRVTVEEVEDRDCVPLYTFDEMLTANRGKPFPGTRRRR